VVRPAAGAGAGDAADPRRARGAFHGRRRAAAVLGKKPTGGHWNSGIAVLRNNGLIETEPAPDQMGASAIVAALFRE